MRIQTSKLYIRENTLKPFEKEDKNKIKIK